MTLLLAVIGAALGLGLIWEALLLLLWALWSLLSTPFRDD